MIQPSPSVETTPVVGVDLGGTKIAAGLVLGSTVIGREVAPTPAREGRAAILVTVIDMVGRLLARPEAASVAGVGIGSAGVIDEVHGTVVSATSHLAEWAGTRLAAEISSAVGLHVWCLNDVHAHALGEHHFGAGSGFTSSLLVAAGTGLGGSLVVDGRPLRGDHYLAGHLGHVPAAEAEQLLCSCGHSGHLECVASGAGLLNAYRGAGGQLTTMPALAAAAEHGDPLAVEWVSRSGRALGRAIGGWANTLDPGVVILAGGLSGAGPTWWESLRAGAAGEALQPATLGIVPARLGVDAAIIGAARYALDHLGASARQPSVDQGPFAEIGA